MFLKPHPHTAASGCHWHIHRVVGDVKLVISQKLARFHLDDVWFFGISNKKYIRWQKKSKKMSPTTRCMCHWHIHRAVCGCSFRPGGQSQNVVSATTACTFSHEALKKRSYLVLSTQSHIQIYYTKNTIGSCISIILTGSNSRSHL